MTVMSNPSQLVTIYTDGSCLENPGPGGWAALLIYNGRRKTICGHALDTTNNRMELNAAIEALLTLKKPCHIALYTDSQYLRLGMTQWLAQWQKNNWRGSNKKEVKNKDLWEKLAALNTVHQIQWHWVKAHAGHKENELVDQLAWQAAQTAKASQNDAH